MTYRAGMLTWTGGGGGGSTTWSSITGKPSTFPPEAHGHIIADVTGLQTALDGKQAAGSYQPLATVLTNTTAAFTTAQESKLAGIASGATANDTDANLKNRANHTGTQAAGTITGLATVATSGSAADLTGNLAVARLNGGTGASSSTFWRGDGTWASADPWTIIKLTADVTTSSTTPADVPGFTFTPDADSDYEVEVVAITTSTVSTVGPRPAVAWGTGYSYGMNEWWGYVSATTDYKRVDTITTTAGSSTWIGGQNVATTNAYVQRAFAIFRTHGTPTAFKMRYASESASSTSLKAGSYMRYRKIA